MPSIDRRHFSLRLATWAAAASGALELTACGGGGSAEPTPATPAPSTPLARFDHGVASGDPGVDRVILWTHARLEASEADVPLTWEVATDASFATVLASGSATATAATGHTAKADATGLQPGQSYHFRFRHGSTPSPVGRTRTLPAAGATELELAVVSCSDYAAGYYHVYAEVARSSAAYWLHLGDVIYEHSAAAGPDGNAIGREASPRTECSSLADYRTRHAQARSDPDAKALYAAKPVLAIWDDHETANDAWRDGAAGHDDATEGRWADRVAAATQAWHEWMPVRTPQPGQRRALWRSFGFGGLADLHLLETRLAGRDAQVPLSTLLDSAQGPAARSAMASASRSLLGDAQRQWLRSQMAGSTARWQLLGQSVLMARMAFPASVLRSLSALSSNPASLLAAQQAVNDYLAAKALAASNPSALTPQQQALLDPAQNPLIGFNTDAWDGYPAEREALLADVLQRGQRLVVLAGDSHNAWGARLRLADGRLAGHEFATPSVTSSGLEADLPMLTPAQTAQLFRSFVDDLLMAETGRRGYLRLSVTASQVRAEWTFVSTVRATTYAVEAGAALTVSA